MPTIKSKAERADVYCVERPAGLHIHTDEDVLRVDRPAGIDDKTWNLIVDNSNRYFLLLQISYLSPDRQALVQAEIRRILDREQVKR